MERVLEPELMDSPTEAIVYDRMDHAEVNRKFVDDLLAALESTRAILSVIDLGTGTAQIPIELCRREARLRVTAVDAAKCMLDVAKRNVEHANLRDRIELRRVDAKQPTAGAFDIVMSNSLVHHLPEPQAFFANAAQLAASGGLLFVRDLFRPATVGHLERLVETYAGDSEPEQQTMLADSLRAALTVEEVQQLVANLGFDRSTVEATSDRHWTWCCKARMANDQGKCSYSCHLGATNAADKMSHFKDADG